MSLQKSLRPTPGLLPQMMCGLSENTKRPLRQPLYESLNGLQTVAPY
jgi:hypothetical protein